MSYTPGPWYACCLGTKKDGCHCGYIFNEGDKTIAKVFHNDPSLKDYERLGDDILLTEKEANARLISAAPDLYEAVKAYLEWGPMTGSDRDLHDKAFRSAIAKAEA